LSKTILKLPILKGLVPAGLSYGTNLLIEFEPRSLWYETSLTMAAHLIRNGIRTDYHAFQHVPEEIREAIANIGVKDISKLEEADVLRVIDSYTLQTGLSEAKGGEELRAGRTLKLSEWSISTAQDIKRGIPEEDKRRVHIDDNTGVLLQYNDEKQLIDHWRTRMIPYVRARGNILFSSVLSGVASPSFHKQFEFICDGIIDFKSEETQGELRQFVRVSALRGKKYDSKWQRLELLDNGEVTLAG
jgi:KaiC/GvpD/RAD55 family RecA-like ATPase